MASTKSAIDRAIDGIDYGFVGPEDIGRAVRALKKAKKDKARLDWIDSFNGSLVMHDDSKPRACISPSGNLDLHWGKKIRQAIDKAMKAEGTNE